MMRRLHPLLFLLLVLPGTSKVLAQDRFILGIATYTDHVKFLLRYDLNQKKTDTLSSLYPIYGSFSTFSSTRTTDVLNGRYFMVGGYAPVPTYKVMCFDNLSGLAVVESTVNPFNLPNVEEYDMFTNELICVTSNEIDVFDLNTKTWKKVMDLPDTLQFSVEMAAYDPFRRQVLYQGYNGSFFCVLLDLQSKKPIAHWNSSNTSTPAMFEFDYTTRKYYSIVNDSIVELDPFTGKYSLVCKILQNLGRLNQEFSSFDQSTETYLLPLYTGTNNNTLFRVDLKNSTWTKEQFPECDFNEVFYEAKPFIKAEGAYLTASFGAGYKWFRNSVEIAGENSQSLNVKEPGTYQVEVTSLQEHVAKSEEKFIDVTSTTGTEQKLSDISISPNPSSGLFTITLPRTEKIVDVSIFDNNGKQLWFEKFNDKQSLNLNLSNLAPGLYQCRINVDNKNTSALKVLIH